MEKRFVGRVNFGTGWRFYCEMPSGSRMNMGMAGAAEYVAELFGGEFRESITYDVPAARHDDAAFAGLDAVERREFESLVRKYLQG